MPTLLSEHVTLPHARALAAGGGETPALALCPPGDGLLPSPLPKETASCPTYLPLGLFRARHGGYHTGR